MFRYLIAVSALSFFTTLSADEQANRIYLSGGVLYRNSEAKFQGGGSMQDREVIPFVELGFDHTKARSIYWGFNLGAGARIDKDCNSGNEITSPSLQGEMRLGYTFVRATRALLMTPFIGFGCFSMFRDFDSTDTGASSTYLAAGLRNSYKYSASWDIDLNLKALRTLNEHSFGRDGFGGKIEMDAPGGHWQFSMELPLRYYPTASRTFDISFVPFFTFEPDIGNEAKVSKFTCTDYMGNKKVFHQKYAGLPVSSFTFGLGIQIGKKF